MDGPAARCVSAEETQLRDGNGLFNPFIVLGVGFLGAGAIMKDGTSVSGLTTAVTLWGTAASGACAEAGMIPEAVVAGCRRPGCEHDPARDGAEVRARRRCGPR